MTDVCDEDIARIYGQWHEFAKARDVEKLLSLYDEDAIFESPLIPAILDDVETGVLRGREEIHRFLFEGTKRRPNHLVRWYRTGQYFTDGSTLVWEYPRETPNGDQVDILEFMEIRQGKIVAHRIYWGWLGFQLLCRNAVDKALRTAIGKK